jgi:hypothetical protein
MNTRLNGDLTKKILSEPKEHAALDRKWIQQGGKLLSYKKYEGGIYKKSKGCYIFISTVDVLRGSDNDVCEN